MPHIPVEAHLPGITGLLEYRKDSAQPIRHLTQLLLRGPSTLTEAERELIATTVSYGNECRFCTAAHTAAADLLLGEQETSAKVKENIAEAPVSGKMKALLTIGALVRESGKCVTPEAIGVRKAMTACFAVCTVMSFVLFKANLGFSGMVHGEIAVLAFFFGVSQGVLSIYIPLLFPTSLRTTATGFCFNIGRVFTGTAVLFVGVLVGLKNIMAHIYK